MNDTIPACYIAPRGPFRIPVTHFRLHDAPIPRHDAAMQTTHLIVEQFFDEADQMRASFEKHFQIGRAHV